MSLWIEPLRETIADLEAAVKTINPSRRAFLKESATLISAKRAGGGELGLNFICTHNSRRSHLSQIWAQVAAHACGLRSLTFLSGGTEATACNPRVIASLRRAGFSVVNPTPTDSNPHYLLQFSDDAEPIELFSKMFDDPFNGQSDFIAMMCCDHADQNCPVINGSVGRVSLHYRDPKESDETPNESAVYDQRRDEIGAEMFALMGLIAAIG
ncbi:MAG: protein-tyrosine-phosphatase [Planctomycetota bacterium]